MNSFFLTKKSDILTLKWEEVVNKVIDWQADFIFFSPMTTFSPAAYKICKEIKKQLTEVVSVFGGHHATAYPKISEMPDVDVVVVGTCQGIYREDLNRGKGCN